MSQHSPSYQMVAVPQTNALGVAGFVISLVGLVTAGILCPIGLILSLVALGRQPKGFAIAGVVLGALGSCGWLFALVVFGGLILAALGIGAFAVLAGMAEPERFEVTTDMGMIAEAIDTEKRDEGYLPASLAELNLEPEILSDPWGRDYRYVLTEDEPGYDLISYGPDGEAETEDDIRLSKLDELWASFIAAEEDDEGRVRLRFGEKTLTAEGDDDGGGVTIDLGDRLLEITGGEDRGHVRVVPKSRAPAPAPGSSDDRDEPARPESGDAEPPGQPDAPDELGSTVARPAGGVRA